MLFQQFFSSLHDFASAQANSAQSLVCGQRVAVANCRQSLCDVEECRSRYTVRIYSILVDRQVDE